MPNRIIKESICVSEKIEKITWFEEALFYRLIVNCDDYGRFDGRPAVIKSRLFPLKETLTTKAVSEAVRKLASVGLVALYEFEGAPYLYLPTWDRHQTVRAKRSKYPAPDNDCASMKTSASICKQMQTNVPVIQSESESKIDVDDDNARDPELARVVGYYAQKINACFGHAESDGIVKAYQLFGADVTICAIDRALTAGVPTWAYIRGILGSWKRQNVKSLADIQRLDADFETQKAKSAGQRKAAQSDKKPSVRDVTRPAAERDAASDWLADATKHRRKLAKKVTK